MTTYSTLDRRGVVHALLSGRSARPFRNYGWLPIPGRLETDCGRADRQKDAGSSKRGSLHAALLSSKPTHSNSTTVICDRKIQLVSIGREPPMSQKDNAIEASQIDQKVASIAFRVKPPGGRGDCPRSDVPAPTSASAAAEPRLKRSNALTQSSCRLGGTPGFWPRGLLRPLSLPRVVFWRTRTRRRAARRQSAIQCGMSATWGPLAQAETIRNRGHRMRDVRSIVGSLMETAPAWGLVGRGPSFQGAGAGWHSASINAPECLPFPCAGVARDPSGQPLPQLLAGTI